MFDFIDKKTFSELALNEFLAPRRAPNKIAEYTNKYLASKNIVIYGAGNHTKTLIACLDKSIKVVCILEDDTNEFLLENIQVLEVSKVLNLQYDAIVISSSYFSYKMTDRLLKLGVKKEKIFDFYDYAFDKKFYYQYEEKHISIDKNDKPNILLIVPFENADHITRYSKKLTKHFNLYKVYYLNSSYMGNNVGFRDIFYFRNGLMSLLGFIKHNKANIDLIVVNTISSMIHVVYFIKKIFPDVKIAVSVLDMLRTLGKKEKVINELEYASRYDFEKKCEAFMIKNADAMLAGIRGEWAEKNIYRKNKKAYESLNYLSKEIFVFKNKKLSASPHLCYAGGVLPSKLNKSISVDIKMINVAIPALNSGCKFDVYATIHAGTYLEENYADYIALSKQNSDFSFFPFLPVEELVVKIAEANFGVMYYDFSIAKKESILKHHLECTIPTKIFTYIAAGLPILISKEIKSAHDFLLDYGVGISVGQKDIKNINKVLRGVDYGRMKESVKSFQDAFNIENKSGEIIDILKRVIG